MEEQNGDHERTDNDEDDAGDLLLGVDEVLENPAIPRREERERQRR